MQRDSFLGTGWGFPITFEKATNGQSKVRMVREVTDIAESLTILFTTRPGERVLRPDYGASLEDLIFEPANTSLISYIKELIKNAILYYEPRISTEKIELSSELLTEGTITIKLDFKIRATNNRFNYVYDYYLREATIRQL